MKRKQFTRREWLRLHAAGLGGLGLVGASASGWFPALAARAAEANTAPKRSAILLWMAGGPAQTDTFDMKPDHANGGQFKEIATAAPGLRFSEHLPKLAQQAERLAVVRSLSTKEGDHQRATQLIRTGYAPGGDVEYPSITCSLAKELGANRKLSLPQHVSIASPGIAPAAFGPGFLGPKFSPAAVEATDATADGFASLKVDNLDPAAGVNAAQTARRQALWQSLQKEFLRNHADAALVAHDGLHRQAIELAGGNAREAFDLTREKDTVREAYGKGRFGQGCLLARRLVERGVPFVEVTLGGNGLGWDTHTDGFRQVKTLSEQLDAGWGTLMTELAERGLLDSTTILCIGEFGRTPAINNQGGRDHFPTAWSCTFAGGGIAGGQAYGTTTDDGMEVADNQVGIGDVLATLCQAVGVDPEDENETGRGRPIHIAEGTPIQEILV